MDKRGKNITTDRLFLTVNPLWKSAHSVGFFKNCPIGRNQISTWTKSAAQKIGLDTKKIKITNHSNRSTVVSCLAKAGVGEHQITKITGHSSTSSIKSYLQLDSDHHVTLVDCMRQNEQEETVGDKPEESKNSKYVYNNCTINNYYK